MRRGRVIALVVGCLFVIPALALLVGGAGLTLAYAFARDDDGYFAADLAPVATDTVAISAKDVWFASEPGSPDWIFDALDLDVRLRVADPTGTSELFIGIAPEADLDAYLAGVAHDEVKELDGDTLVLESRPGEMIGSSPTDETFWAASSFGPGTQELTWEAQSGRWSAVVMNADGSPGVVAEIEAGAKALIVLPLGLTMMILGLALTAGSVALIVVGARSAPEESSEVVAAEPPAVAVGAVAPVPSDTPVVIEAVLDPDLSRWRWLVKWFLAIPHFIILMFLWIAFVMFTVVAGVAIFFTGAYPRSIFDFNVGVLRWSWRVSYYATVGGVGTDRYPPFSLGPEPDYPATLEVAYPEQLSRGLVLVKWWLLAIPHYLIVGLLMGGSFVWLADTTPWLQFELAGFGGVLGLLVFVAAVVLLVTDEYPRSLLDLIVGFNRWIYRVVAYAALMTDQYPPFRLDQGGDDPTRPSPSDAPPAHNGSVDLREPVESVPTRF